MGLKRVILGWDFVDWIIAILVVSFAIGGVAQGVDWLDRRACRTNGGTVVEVERDWRCQQ